MKDSLALELTIHKRAFVSFFLEIENSSAAFLIVNELTFVNGVVIGSKEFTLSIFLASLELAFVFNWCFEIGQSALSIKLVIFEMALIIRNSSQK